MAHRRHPSYLPHDGLHDSGWDTFGNAMLYDAGSTLSVLGGLALVAGGLGEEAGGVLLDATGIGAGPVLHFQCEAIWPPRRPALITQPYRRETRSTDSE